MLQCVAQVRAQDAPALLELSTKDWPMYGGHLQRNFANPLAKGLPDSWDISDGTNVAYSIQLGSRAYGGPVMSGGRILIGTNNEFPRDPSIKGDKGVMMCFNEKDGAFLVADCSRQTRGRKSLGLASTRHLLDALHRR